MLKSIAIAFMLWGSVSLASAPMAKTQAPGFYRFMLGDFEITTLSDGTVALPMNTLMLNTTQKKVESELKKFYLDSPTETSVNTFLINTGTKLVLVDAGAASLFGPTLGKLVSNLKASGYTPDQIDEIYITHLHNDHIGGLTNDGKVTFPNAIIRADQHDLDFWLSKENMDKAPEGMKPFFQGPMNVFLPLQKANKVKPFEGDTQLIDGIKAVQTHGHTAGHTVYVVESKGKKLILIGDLIHLGAVQFAHPEVTIQYDSNTKEAAIQRKKIFESVAKEGAIVGASHLSFPGVGHIQKEGKKFIWLPLNYSQL